MTAVAAIQAQPGPARWWGPPDQTELRGKAAGTDDSTAFAIEQDGESEDVHGHGLGTDAVRTLGSTSSGTAATTGW